jgi:hypothetical protein
MLKPCWTSVYYQKVTTIKPHLGILTTSPPSPDLSQKESWDFSEYLAVSLQITSSQNTFPLSKS